MTEKPFKMRIEGMSCVDCERRVARALQAAGARVLKVSWPKAEALIGVPEGFDLSRLARAVSAAGYEPGPVEPVLSAEFSGPPPMPDAEYDLAIIGSGSAAFAAAIRAVELGARVLMVERGTLGGTCVNVGCVPSKALLRAAEVFYEAGHHPFAGVYTRAEGVDPGELVGQKAQLIAELRREKYADLVDFYGWELVHGEARFEGPDVIAVNGRRIKARAYLIATGASPAVPPIPGLAESGFLTYVEALELKEVPGRLAVIGANAVGLELGQYFQMLGSRVTFFEIMPRIAPFEEPEVSEALAGAFKARGFEILTDARVERVEGGRIYARVGNEELVREFDRVLVATGRRPNTKELGLEAAGVEVDGRGAVVVDEYLRTTNPRVWAAGDVTGGPQFVYVAAYEGKVAAENILVEAGRRVELEAVPRVTFTDPQVAAVGLGEAEARRAGYEVRTGVVPAKEVVRARVNRRPEGLFKLVADGRTGRLLGAHLVSEQAGEAIYGAVLAVKYGLKVEELAESFAPYLTMSEGLRLAALAFSREVARLSCCAG